MKSWRWLLVTLLALGGCSRDSEVAKATVPHDNYVFEPSRRAAAYVTLIENPAARQVLLLGAAAKAMAPVFTNAGVRVAGPKDGKVGALVVDCGEMTPQSCARAAERLTDDGVMAWWLDVGELTVGDFKLRLESFALAEVHLWMPSESHWLLVGRRKPRKVDLAAMLEVFARESAFEDLAKAGAGTLPELFANYVGRREEVSPAFQDSDSEVVVRPEFFLTKEIPPLQWVTTENLDEDIGKALKAEMRSMQVVRREVVEGNVLSLTAKDKQGETAAVEKWNRAALRSPRDLFLLERLDRLDRNARGFLSLGKLLQAMKCYETMVLIKPTAAAVHNFGMCLKKLGKQDMAEQVLKRAETLAEQASSGQQAGGNLP